MKKKFDFIFLVFPFIWGFYFWMAKGYIGLCEETDFFVSDRSFWERFMTKPGGWTEYAACFLLQFYKWKVAGAFLLTFFPLLAFVFTRKMVGRLGISRRSVGIASIPFIVMCSIQCYSGSSLSEMLKVVCFLGLVCGFMYIPQVNIRYILYTLGLPFFYLVLSPVGCIFLYVTLMLYDLKSGRRKFSWEVYALWGVLLILYPRLWQNRMYIMPDENLYFLSERNAGGKFIYGLWFVYAYGIVLWVLSFRKERKRKEETLAKPSFNAGRWSVFIILLGIGLCCFYPYRQERFWRLDQAVEKGEWEEALREGKQIEELSREEFYLIALALANKGMLGEQLFDFPVWGIGCLYLPRETDYSTSILGSEFYYRMKIPNEAIHWAFQASVASQWGMNFRILRRLVELNLMKGDRPAADKYLALLEHSTLHRSWCKEKREDLQQGTTERIYPQEAYDFFIGGRPFLSDMGRIIDAGRGKGLVLDYILCGLLLNKDLEKFCQIFTGYYFVQEGEKIPKAYEEALLVAEALGRNAVTARNYSIRPETREAFQSYNTLYKNYRKNAKQMGKFRNTWWYYCHFITMKSMDEQGYLKDRQAH